MKNTRSLEIGTGLFVLLGFAALAYLTTQLPGTSLKLAAGPEGYAVTAKFDNIGDLKSGSPVTMAGVTIGRVESIRFDPKDYKAAVVLRIENQYKEIPDDSDASIQTAGLLGGKYVGIGPGGSETFLKEGGQIEFTQSATSAGSLIQRKVLRQHGEQGIGRTEARCPETGLTGEEMMQSVKTFIQVGFIAGLLVAGSAVAADPAPRPQWPLMEGGADRRGHQRSSQLIESSANVILSGIDARRARRFRKDPTGLYALVENTLLPHFDTPYAAQLVLGQHWRTRTRAAQALRRCVLQVTALHLRRRHGRLHRGSPEGVSDQGGATGNSGHGAHRVQALEWHQG
jgi:phospholipid/cholesterol/gamma-HCH transport system substrate-binding protein